MEAKINKVTIRVIQDDILSLAVDGLVVVTDPNLSVSEELTRSAGPEVKAEAAKIGWSDVGSAVATNAGNLPHTMIIHAVAPRWGEGSERGKLANVTWACLSLAEDYQLKSIALPAISIGTLGYPLESSAGIMITRIIDFTFENLKYLRTVVICLHNLQALEVFRTEFQRQIKNLRETGEGRVRA